MEPQNFGGTIISYQYNEEDDCFDTIYYYTMNNMIDVVAELNRLNYDDMIDSITIIDNQNDPIDCTYELKKRIDINHINILAHYCLGKMILYGINNYGECIFINKIYD